MNDVVFREYDIRGIVGQELYIEEVYNLAQAIGHYFLNKNSMVRTIVVGMDVRTHAPYIKDEVCRSLLDAGFNIIFIGLCTSPILYYAISVLHADAGIMITASHNPKEYNGLKICLGSHMVHGTELQIIRSLYHEHKRILSASRGTLITHDITNYYIDMLYNAFQHLVGSSLPMVFDCANGSAAIVMPALIKRMRWAHAQALHAQPDGNFPNHPADPIIEENMRDVRAAIQESHALVGIGFDGDADRMGAMASNGILVSGDKLIALFAQSMQAKTGACTVVYDINASAGLPALLSTWHIPSIMAPCGHSNIKKYMHKYNALLGGEISCHFLFKDRSYESDDGIYAAMRLIEILHEDPNALINILVVFPAKISSPRYRLPCAESDKNMLVNTVYEYCSNKPELTMLTIDGVRIATQSGWGLVRSSNTQAMLCFSFEADTLQELQKIQRIVADALASVYSYNLYTIFGL
ncbi:MAG TPA: phosphomannomutase/phosphoglucomutase [Candidatus Babeliales bacterium]|jgi:phosphomannomutase/phosphoglucomutase|nr:phosphomannomutase/phosphoglucomutase [Candidatus Babeliales bacterium]